MAEIEPGAILRAEIAVLESLCGPEWLKSPGNQRHPAKQRYDLCLNALAKTHGRSWPISSRGEALATARMILDGAIIMQLSGGKVRELTLGDLRSFGDALVQRKVRSRITDPEAFEDLFVEFSVAANHLAKDHLVTPLEQDNKPDLLIHSSHGEAGIECKRLRVASANAMYSDISNANRQLRSLAAEFGGALVIDISAHASITHDRDSDDILPQVTEAEEWVRAAFKRGPFRSISRLALVWDESSFVLDASMPPWAVLRRRTYEVELEKRTDRRGWPEPLDLFTGFTVMANIDIPGYPQPG
jgi:hypothetical protein